MSTVIIVLLILLGLFLLILEFFALPGVTFAGIGGVILIGAGVAMAYRSFGNTGGNATLIGTLLISIMLLIWSLRSGTWNKLMLKSEMSANVEVKEDSDIEVGDEGVAITRLNPIGKALVNKIAIEARCPGQFVDANTELIVTKVYKTYIVVKPKK